MRGNIKGCDRVTPTCRGEKISPGGHLIVAHYEVVGRVFSKATRPASARDDRLAACARDTVCKPRTEVRSSLQDGTIFNAGSHHFVVGYYQMSRRDEVLSECYLALCDCLIAQTLKKIATAAVFRSLSEGRSIRLLCQLSL
jgi:hypothetical protein